MRRVDCMVRSGARSSVAQTGCGGKTLQGEVGKDLDKRPVSEIEKQLLRSGAAGWGRPR